MVVDDVSDLEHLRDGEERRFFEETEQVRIRVDRIAEAWRQHREEDAAWLELQARIEAARHNEWAGW